MVLTSCLVSVGNVYQSRRASSLNLCYIREPSCFCKNALTPQRICMKIPLLRPIGLNHLRTNASSLASTQPLEEDSLQNSPRTTNSAAIESSSSVASNAPVKSSSKSPQLPRDATGQPNQPGRTASGKLPKQVERSLFGRFFAWWYLESPQSKAQGESHSSDLRPIIRKLAQLVAPDHLMLGCALCCMVVAAVAELAIPHYSTKSVFAASQKMGKAEIDRNVQRLILLVFAYGSFAAMRGFCFSMLNNRMTRRLRAELFSTLIFRETEFFDQTDVGALTSRLQADCQAMAKCVATNLNIAMRNAIQAIGGIVYLYALERRLCLATLGITALLWGLALCYGDFARRSQKVFQDVLAMSNTAADESLSLSRTVRTFATERQEEKRYGTWLTRLYEIGLRQAAGYSLFVMAGHWACYASKAVALVIGCTMVLQGTLSAEQLTNFIFYVEFVTYASLNVCDEYTELMEAMGASERVVGLMDKPAAPQTRAGHIPRSFSGRVELRNVVFNYASRPRRKALDGVSLSFEPGSVTALVGLSGSGKTTLVALLQRLYDPTAGELLVGEEDERTREEVKRRAAIRQVKMARASARAQGISAPVEGLGSEDTAVAAAETSALPPAPPPPVHDLRAVDAAWYRSQIGVVSQEPRLFATTIHENITYGLPVGKATREDVVEAARASNAHDFILSLPHGYDTRVTDKLLSGGQRQRIALARALVRKPKLLILDEATSALDAETEALVQAALDRAMEGGERAVVVIAHRLSTVRNADKIVVMDKGKIIEMGTHEALLLQQGAYANLISRQQGQPAAKATGPQEAVIPGIAKVASQPAVAHVAAGDGAAEEAAVAAASPESPSLPAASTVDVPAVQEPASPRSPVTPPLSQKPVASSPAPSPATETPSTSIMSSVSASAASVPPTEKQADAPQPIPLITPASVPQSEVRPTVAAAAAEEREVSTSVTVALTESSPSEEVRASQEVLAEAATTTPVALVTESTLAGEISPVSADEVAVAADVSQAAEVSPAADGAVETVVDEVADEVFRKGEEVAQEGPAAIILHSEDSCVYGAAAAAAEAAREGEAAAEATANAAAADDLTPTVGTEVGAFTSPADEAEGSADGAEPVAPGAGGPGDAAEAVAAVVSSVSAGKSEAEVRESCLTLATTKDLGDPADADVGAGCLPAENGATSPVLQTHPSGARSGF